MRLQAVSRVAACWVDELGIRGVKFQCIAHSPLTYSEFSFLLVDSPRGICNSGNKALVAVQREG